MMMQRRRHQQANAKAEQPEPVFEPPALDRQIDDACVQRAIGEAMREYLSTRGPAKAEPAASNPESRPPPTKRHESVLPERLKGLSPTESAIRNGSAAFASRPPRSTTYRSELLRHTALHHVVGHEVPG
jgi:hypothetical protein